MAHQQMCFTVEEKIDRQQNLYLDNCSHMKQKGSTNGVTIDRIFRCKGRSLELSNCMDTIACDDKENIQIHYFTTTCAPCLGYYTIVRKGVCFLLNWFIV